MCHREGSRIVTSRFPAAPQSYRLAHPAHPPHRVAKSYIFTDLRTSRHIGHRVPSVASSRRVTSSGSGSSSWSRSGKRAVLRSPTRFSRRRRRHGSHPARGVATRRVPSHAIACHRAIACHLIRIGVIRRSLGVHRGGGSRGGEKARVSRTKSRYSYSSRAGSMFIVRFPVFRPPSRRWLSRRPAPPPAIQRNCDLGLSTSLFPLGAARAATACLARRPRRELFPSTAGRPAASAHADTLCRRIDPLRLASKFTAQHKSSDGTRRTQRAGDWTAVVSCMNLCSNVRGQ